MNWSRRFYEPIPVPKGKPLRTLGDAKDYALAVPKAKAKTHAWQTAALCLSLGAKNNVAQMAEIAMRAAINGPKPGPTFDDPNRKVQRWGKKRDAWR